MPTCEVKKQELYIPKAYKLSKGKVMKFCMKYAVVALLIGQGPGHRKSNRELDECYKMGMEGPL